MAGRGLGKKKRLTQAEICKRYHESPKGQLNTRRGILKHYGLTIEDYEVMRDLQGSRCAICTREETALTAAGRTKLLSVDHNHKTGEIRALLCNRCNSLLGYVDDDIDLFRKAIKYLEKYLGH